MVMTGTAFRPAQIEKIALGVEMPDVLAYDTKLGRLKKVPVNKAKMTKREAEVVEVPLSNGAVLKVTPDHRILHRLKGWVEAKDLAKGDEIISLWSGHDVSAMGMMTQPRPGRVWVEGDPLPYDELVRVFNLTTPLGNFVCEGVVIHMSGESE